MPAEPFGFAKSQKISVASIAILFSLCEDHVVLISFAVAAVARRTTLHIFQIPNVLSCRHYRNDRAARLDSIA